MKQVIVVGVAVIAFFFAWHGQAGRGYAQSGEHGWRAAFALVAAIFFGAIAYSAVTNP
jgi:hypothetical protein